MYNILQKKGGLSMINYRKDKERYKVNDLGSLYVNSKKLSKNEQPIIYVGGQLSHHEHMLELMGFSPDLNYNEYTGCWMYDYSIFSKNKNSINAENFSENLLLSLKEAKLNDVILVTFSHGGIIGAYASKSELINKVISIHPAIIGTPLVNYEELKKYNDIFNSTQKIIAQAIKYIIDFNYGFEQDNFNGADLRKVDLNKVLVVGNALNPNLDKNKLLKETFKIIKMLTGFPSDGAIVFEPKEFDRLGINYMNTSESYNHTDAQNPDFVKKYVNKIINETRL